MPGPNDPSRFLRPDAESVFRGEDGKNVFADSTGNNVPAEQDSNLYAAPNCDPALEDGSVIYETMSAHRGPTILILGIVGFVWASVGSLALFCCVPLPLFALSVSMPAYLMARADLLAMKAGAMQIEGQTQTRWGFWLGLIASIWSLLITAVFLAWMLRSSLFQ